MAISLGQNKSNHNKFRNYFRILLLPLPTVTNQPVTNQPINHPPMGTWKQIAEYLYIKKRDPNEPRTQWMKYMHGMNRISLIMFLLAVLIILFKLVILPLFR
ncbi:MAG: hypothetical protein EPO58_01595 [Chitinophagaceae bacterium]|nr:MAG: hypothetical protein EPO58_01595 [Chitinophagaceae bacterium]